MVIEEILQIYLPTFQLKLHKFPANMMELLSRLKAKSVHNYRGTEQHDYLFNYVHWIGVSKTLKYILEDLSNDHKHKPKKGKCRHCFLIHKKVYSILNLMIGGDVDYQALLKNSQKYLIDPKFAQQVDSEKIDPSTKGVTINLP